MSVAQRLGLDDERFCKVILRNKMFGMVNVLGHLAELHLEKLYQKDNKKLTKAGTDEHYDYVHGDERIQVKRWNTSKTDDNYIGVNLTKTHGNRKGSGAFYKKTAFDTLILYDVGFMRSVKIPVNNIPVNRRYSECLIGSFSIPRTKKMTDHERQFLCCLKEKNEKFPLSMDRLIKSSKMSHVQLLEKITNLTLDEIYSVFNKDNFRLITGAKGFVAEEHFNTFLEKNNIKFTQSDHMYDKTDHLVNNKRVQVKTPHIRSMNEDIWAFKTHKTHGSGRDELYKHDAFDVVALFVGYEYENDDKYMPKQTESKFVLFSVDEIPRHHKYKDRLKRITKINRKDHKVNDLSLVL